MITDVDGRSSAADGALTARVDLLGEIQRIESGFPRFQRGITGYPVVGDHVDARQRRLAPGLRHRRRRHHQHRPSAAGQLDRRLRQGRRDAAQALRLVRHDGRRQIERRRRHPAPVLAAKPQPAHLPDRPAQRVRQLLPRPGAGPQPQEPQAAVLAVQLRGDGRRVLPRPARPGGRGGDPGPGHPAGQGPVRRRARRRGADAAQDRFQQHPFTVDTPVPTGCRTSST